VQVIILLAEGATKSKLRGRFLHVFVKQPQQLNQIESA
jgi:hypothetical protein